MGNPRAEQKIGWVTYKVKRIARSSLEHILFWECERRSCHYGNVTFRNVLIIDLVNEKENDDSTVGRLGHIHSCSSN